jgi:hypothetical protein
VKGLVLTIRPFFLRYIDNMKSFIIYSMSCPKCGCPRYVGQSSKGAKRFQDHLRGIKAGDNSIHKQRWVQSLLDEGLAPIWTVLLVLADAKGLNAAEIFWIKEMKDRGCPLTNFTEGGGGTKGWEQSPETIEKRVAHFRGVPKSAETKAKISASLKGCKQPWAGQPVSAARQAALDKLHAMPPFQDQHGRQYKSIKEAADRWKLPPGNICNVLKGKRKSCGGLTFTYLDAK